jgi:hypothetical protein
VLVKNTNTGVSPNAGVKNVLALKERDTIGQGAALSGKEINI